MIDLSASTEDTEKDIPVTTSKPDRFWLVAAVLIAFAVFMNYRGSDRTQPDPDDTVIVDDDKTKPSPAPSPSLKGTHLVYVFESTGYPAWIDDVVESESSESLKGRGFTGWRSYDPQMDEVKSLVDFAASKQIAAPFVALVKSLKTMEPVKIEPFPKDAPGLQRFLK